MARYAFFKGVNRYNDPSITSLKCAERDARDLSGIFQHKLGFDARYLEENTAEEIVQRIDQIGQRLKPGDTFLFYFAGHGKEHGDDQLFLLPGVKRSTLDAGLTLGVLTFKTLRALTEGLQWQGVHRLFIFDSCRSPLDSTRDGDAAHFKGEAILRDPGPASRKQGGNAIPLTILNACSEGQSAIELIDDQGQGSGAFTLALKDEIDSGAFQLDETTIHRLTDRMAVHMRARGFSAHQQIPFIAGALPVRLYEPEKQHSENKGRDLDERQWKLACQRNTVAAYEDHLNDERFVCAHVDEALARIAALENAAAEQAQTADQAARADVEKAVEVARLAQLAEEQRKREAVEASARLETAAKEEREAAERRAREEAAAQRLKSEQAERAARVAAENAEIEREKAAEARIQQEKASREAAERLNQQSVLTPEKKSGVPGWAWGLGVIVLGGLALSLGQGGEAPTESPTPVPVTAEIAPAPTQVSADPFAGEMVAIPLTGRPFSMGDYSSFHSNENPAHPVTIRRGYELGQTEVTQGQWKAVMGSLPPESYFKTCGEDCPAANVSWDDIKLFLKKLNEKTGKQYRLPTEAEWEYACRAGGSHKYCGSEDPDAVAWYDNNSGETVHAVAQKGKNAFGLYDMSGNVWEYVQDCYHDSYLDAPDDGSEWQGSCSKGAMRVVRGGSWTDERYNTRSANRGRCNLTGMYDIGFRLARTLT